MCSSSPPILVWISSLSRPWQNGKVERFNRTLQTEWASGKSSSPTAPAQQFCQTSSAATTTNGDTTPSEVVNTKSKVNSNSGHGSTPTVDTMRRSRALDTRPRIHDTERQRGARPLRLRRTMITKPQGPTRRSYPADASACRLASGRRQRVARYRSGDRSQSCRSGSVVRASIRCCSGRLRQRRRW